MGLLKDLLRVDVDRRNIHQAFRQETQQRRLQIEELAAEAKRKRDEIGMLEDGLRRLAEDIARAEEALLELERKREEHEREAHARKVEATKAQLAADRRDGARVAADFLALRSEFDGERERLLSLAETGRMMDNYFQIETFLKDASQPIPDAARKALLKERADLMTRIGPLVAPPPSPDSILKATVVYSAIEDGEPRVLVALGLPDENETSGANDLPAALTYGAYASVVEKLGEGAPRPVRSGDILVFEMPTTERAADESALDLFLAVEDGIKRAAGLLSVRCELTGVFLEPEIASDVFPRG